MNSSRQKLSLLIRCLLLTAVGVTLAAPPAFPQEGKGPRTIEEGKRPRSIDEGEAKVTPRPVIIKKIVVPVAPRAAHNWIVLRPEVPDSAEAAVIVTVDGKPVTKSAEDDYRMELPAGRSYKVSVSAGADYERWEHTVALSAKEPFIKPVPLKYRFGSIRIVTAEAALDGARVLINGKPQAATVDRDKSALVINRVEPGTIKITFDHPDYVLYERNAQVQADTEYTWTVFPERPVGEIDIQTDPKTTVYLDDEWKGETTPEGTLKLSGVRIGSRQVKLIKNGFEEYNAASAVDFKKTVNIRHKLVPRPPSTYFNSNFTAVDASAWVLPDKAARVEANHLLLNAAAALAYPKNISYYDFDMQFHLQLLSDDGAAWALRTADPNNYYLFYLCGPKGPVPNAFITYVVRDGHLDLTRPAVSPSPILVYPERGYEYTIIVEARGNVINHKIIPSKKNLKEKEQVGSPLTLGSFTDKDSLFLFGGIGFRCAGAESFAVSDLYVTPVNAATPKR